MKMTDTSMDTLETSYDTTTVSQTTDTTLSEDDDDELLALRIAALESIKLQKSKAASEKVSKAEEIDKPAQQFVVKSHPKRSNLLSIVTCEEEQEELVPDKRLSPPPLTMPYFDPTRPPPGLPRPRDRFSPPPNLFRRSRSPMYRRYRSRSPGPGRRPWSRSPPPPAYLRRRSTSPPPLRRRRSFSRSPPRRSPPRRRSPGVKSPVRERTPSLSESEWETDTETEEEPEDDKKEEEEKKDEATESEKKEESKESTETEDKKEEKKEDKKVDDDDGDDLLKLDATAEEDEFSAFLNEFEDEVLAKKEEPKKKVKKERPVTEKKVVEGKKLRKKIKPIKPTPPPSERRSKSPKLSRSPGRRYFSPGRGKDNRLSPSKRDREDRTSQERLKRSSKSKDRTLKDSAPVETAAERAAREQKEYEERISKLSTPERERMEARRKKFEKKIDTNKKISLKSDKADDEVNFEIKRRNRDSVDSGDNENNGEDKSPPVRRNVTDLRVQLHKKRKAQETEPETRKPKLIVQRSKNPLLRSLTPSPEKEVVAPADLEEDDFGPIESSGRRRVVAPSRKIISKDSEEESDRSPSPPAKVPERNGQKKIVVLRKTTSSLKDDFSITRAPLSPSKGLKKSLHLRLGGKVESEDADKDIYMDILRNQEAKKKTKKLKKEKKKEKKEKKKSKKRKEVDSDVSDKEPEKDIDSDEELFRFFEEPEPKAQKRRSKDLERQLSGDLVKKKFVRAKFDSEDVEDLVEKYREDDQSEERRKVKSKRRISNEGSLDEESSDLLEKMRKKNEKRLRRMKEIERDRIMFS